MGQELWLVRHHLRRNASNKSLLVAEIILVWVSRAHLIRPSAIRVVIMRVRVSGITAIIIIAFRVPLALRASILIWPRGVVGVARLVWIFALVATATISARLSVFRGGLCIRRLNSRRRSGVAARVNLLEVHWL